MLATTVTSISLSGDKGLVILHFLQRASKIYVIIHILSYAFGPTTGAGGWHGGSLFSAVTSQ